MVRTGEILNQDIQTAQKRSFQLRIFLLNVTKLAAVRYPITLTCSVIIPNFDLAFTLDLFILY